MVLTKEDKVLLENAKGWFYDIGLDLDRLNENNSERLRQDICYFIKNLELLNYDNTEFAEMVKTDLNDIRLIVQSGGMPSFMAPLLQKYQYIKQ